MELSLDLSLTFARRTISELLGEVSKSKEGSQKMTMLEDYVKKLEDEMRKIEAFKRELPLCMILVNYAIARLKEEIEGCMRTQDEPVVEELMPLMKTNFEGKGSFNMWKEISDKKNWMSSAQLWSVETKLRSEEDNWSVPENPIEPPNETNNNGRAFLSFSGNSKTVKRDEKEVSHFPNLSLMTPEFEQNHRKSKRGCGGSHDSSLITSKIEIKGQPQQQQQQNPRKQRRCWSPELHRRFVDALHQLGGPQVATPKQIRELMQVGGLTNDEVKSHLQKYRLHFRRVPDSSVGQANKGLWMAQDQCGHKSKGNLSGSPQGPLFLRGSAKVLSSSGQSSVNAEDDEQSDCHSWKSELH